MVHCRLSLVSDCPIDTPFATNIQEYNSIVLFYLLQVKPSSQLDPCITPVEEVSSKLQNLVLGEDSKLDEFIRKGEISKVTLLALSVLKAANTDTSECKQPLSQGLKTLVRARISK